MQLSPADVAGQILAGQNIFIYRSHVICVPQKWLDKHPGGALPILHFVGRDASDEIDAYHSNPGQVLRYSIGTVAEKWKPLLPPVSLGWVRKENKWYREAVTLNSDTTDVLLVEETAHGLQGPTLASITPQASEFSPELLARHSEAYQALHNRIIEAGLYETPYISGYGPEVVRYILLAFGSAFAYYKNWQITSAVCLGLMWHQLMFIAHDLGHMGVSHNWVIDRLVSIFIADFIGGLSIGWWVNNHNVHHIVTNHPCHDPDIEHLPFFAISPSFFSNIYSTFYKRTLPFDRFSRFIIAVQHRLFYIVMAFARFNLYRLSYGHLLSATLDPVRARGGKWAWRLEILGVLSFWLWFGALLWGCGTWQKALVYLLVSHVVTSPLHVQIVLSHFSMSTADLGPSESFVHRQLRTTCDVICPPSLAFLHGGLHLQVTHHLFPRLPRHNLKKASEMVKQFAKDEGLTYAEFGFINGNKEVMSVLKDVADQVGLMFTVASVEAKEAVDKKFFAASKQ